MDANQPQGCGFESILFGDDEFIAACLRMLSGELDASTARALAAELDASDEKRRLYVQLAQHAQYISELLEHSTYVAENSDDPYAGDIISEVVESAKMRRYASEVAASQAFAITQTADRPNWRSAMDKASDLRRVVVIPKSVTWLGLAAAVALIASVIWFVLPETNSSVLMDRNEVATVDAMINVRLAGGQALAMGDRIQADRRYRIEHGLISLITSSGSTVTIQAPADFSMSSGHEVHLRAGKLVGYVPDAAENLFVYAPGMVVEDLGTEFAVRADSVLGSEIHVLDGEVLVKAADVGGHAASFKAELLTAGNARQVKASGQELSAIDVEPGAFYRSVPTTYELAVRQARPKAYWRFRSPSTATGQSALGRQGSLLQGISANLLKINTPLSLETDDRALFLTDHTAPIITEGEIDLDLNNAFTIAMWVWVPEDADRRMRAVANNMHRLPDDPLRGGFGLGVSADQPDTLGDPVLLFTAFGVYDAVSTQTIQPERWVHIAVSINESRTLSMYIDGQRVSHRLSIEPELEKDSLAFLPGSSQWVIGNRIGDSPVDGPERWSGGIDELAVYGRAIGDDDIARLADRSGTSGGFE